MTRDPFLVARERVTAREAAEYYGLRIDRHGKALCPFHPDNHPSMSFKEGRYRCWACDASGDAVDLVRGLYGLSYAEALRCINQDFHLGLEVGGNLTPHQKAQARRQAQERERTRALHRQFELWREGTVTQLNACIRLANTVDWDNLTDQQAEAIRRREQLEAWADQLSHGTPEDQMQLFRARKRVKLLTTSILSTMQEK